MTFVLVIREFRFRDVSAINQNRKIFIDMGILLVGLVAAESAVPPKKAICGDRSIGSPDHRETFF
jgi:hypothetical protein